MVKHTQAIVGFLKQFVGESRRLFVVDHFVGLALEELSGENLPKPLWK